ncbi:unnamed protein product [Orchesella dallaii]|uniref:Uncharacterized protein n=1 Tax=Orchesella dallaii TaxID=48710 RepID=A0ABP1Q265_9HEXA
MLERYFKWRTFCIHFSSHKMLTTVEPHKQEDTHSTNSDSVIGCGGSGFRRKPLQLLTGIFGRKSNRKEPDTVSEPGEKSFYITDESVNDGWGEAFEDIPEPREALHSPYHARTIDQDMENLRLSRQDNPYLQVLASRECLNESDDGSEYEEKSLMSKNSKCGMKDPLTLAEVHARLVRSPPPVMWTRNRNSEPSFAVLSSFHSTDQECVFQFPPHPGTRLLTDPSPTPTCRSHPSTNAISMNNRMINHGLDYGLRFRENTLDDVTGKFNLSPQPRRRPEGSKGRPFSDFNS